VLQLKFSADDKFHGFSSFNRIQSVIAVFGAAAFRVQ
jgi:hypothetical protein